MKTEEPELIKWKISAAEKRSQSPPNRKETVINLRKQISATPESRAKSRHLRSKCSCLDGQMCEWWKQHHK